MLARIPPREIAMETTASHEKRWLEALEYATQPAGGGSTESVAHCLRVGAFARVLARAIGWSELNAQSLESAARLHDVGKIGIPRSILMKAGPLTERERQQIQRHSILGRSLLCNSGHRRTRMASRIAAAHHERWDGRGYP